MENAKKINKKYWFKNKRYGYGWVPASIEGWLVIFFFVLIVGLSTILLAEKYPVYAMLINVIDTIILVAISYLKGEKPNWQWGNKKSD